MNVTWNTFLAYQTEVTLCLLHIFLSVTFSLLESFSPFLFSFHFLSFLTCPHWNPLLTVSPLQITLDGQEASVLFFFCVF